MPSVGDDDDKDAHDHAVFPALSQAGFPQKELLIEERERETESERKKDRFKSSELL